MSKRIVIVGAGLAGLSAALNSVKCGAEVILISSAPSERAQSVMAEGGINAAMNTKDENDSAELHAKDTIRSGCGLADEAAIKGMAEYAPELVRWLVRLGVQFNRDKAGNVDMRNFGGQKKKRTVFAGNNTGKQIMTALIDEVRKYEVKGRITRYNHHYFNSIIVEDGKCVGCRISKAFGNEVQSISADAVIIATGGMHGIFGNTTGSLYNTGLAVANLFYQGMAMSSLEMVQFHPTTVGVGAKRLLVSEAARGEGGRLFAERDGKRWYFMEEKYPELGNLQTRDITSREIWNVSRNYSVYLDMTGLDRKVWKERLKELKSDVEFFLHIDPAKKPVPVAPGIHYFMGGIYVDEKHRTSVKGVYAAGECCCQYHGANRLGGNSLLGALYGGYVAANSACKDDDSYSNEFEVKIRDNPLQAADSEQMIRINHILQENVGVIRDEAALSNALDELNKLIAAKPSTQGILARAIILSAINRKESRGAHYRSDYPDKDSQYDKQIIAIYNGSDVELRYKQHN